MIEELKAQGCSALVRSVGGELRSFHKRGVEDIYYLLKEEPEFMMGASLADKIIGKGAAALMIKAGVREVETIVISQGALSLFEKTNILLSFEQITPHIINRRGDGWCPVELSCRATNNIDEIIEIIDKRFEDANKQN